MTERAEWSDFFPEGVPPSNATAAEGDAFRLVKSIPPTASDFVSTFEENPNREVDKLGMIFGVSFHRQLECSMRTRQRFKPLRNRHIVVGKLKNDHGVQLSTPSSYAPSHFTLWKRKTSIIHPEFTINAEE